MKNKSKSFIFIMGASIVTLVVLVVLSFVFAKDSSLAFGDDGYIITSTSERVYFKSGTTYKENLSHEYAFVNDNNEDVSVSMDSFIHYSDNSIVFMKNGALMDLNSANMSIIPYYNVTNKSTIVYSDGKFVINAVGKRLEFDDILGRISDDKYIVAGKNISLKLPEVATVVESDYFEITFIENGIVKIDNQEKSYQTTAQGTYIYVGDKIVIDLGGMKVTYDGDDTVSLTQITIDGNENIDVLQDDEAVKPSDSSNTGTSGDDNNGQGTGTGDNQETNGNDNDTEGNGTSLEEGLGDSSYVQLLDASVGVNKISVTFKYNNLDKLSGDVMFKIVDVSTGNTVYETGISKDNVTETIPSIETLSPDTNYLMSVYNKSDDVQYFQQTFRTEELGVVLNRVYASTNSLSYKINYNDNSSVISAKLSIYSRDDYDSVSGDFSKIEAIASLSSNAIENEELTFNNLDSNTEYVVNVDSVVMGNSNYVNVYNIIRTDVTLKVVPDASTMVMDVTSSKDNAILSVDSVTDKDSSIKSYTFKVYDATSYSSDGNNRVLFSKTVSVSGETDEASLKFSMSDLQEDDRDLTRFRFSVDITYYDNEKTMTLYNQGISKMFELTDDSTLEQDAGRIILDFEQDGLHGNKIEGVLKITDLKSKILVNGINGVEGDTKLDIKYYSGVMSSPKTISVSIDSSMVGDDGVISVPISLTGLLANSGYIIEVSTNMYDDEGNISYQLVDRSVTGKTSSDIDKLKFDVGRNNGSDEINVINFEGTITATNSENEDTLDRVTVKLYRGSNVEAGNQIGNTVVLSGSDIYEKNFNFTNNVFGITDLEDLISKSGGNLVQNYTIELTEAYYVSGNLTEVENNVYTYTISLAFMLEQQLEDPTIAVSPILNGTTDSDFDESTVIGYEITTGAATEKLKELVGTNGIESINYYIYRVNSDGEEELIKTIQSDALSMELYFEGIEGYNRGGKYIFKYDISLAGLADKYPTKPVTSEMFTPEKQSPLYMIYKSSSTLDQLVYKYKFIDVDDAIHTESDGGYKFYYTVNDGDDYVTKELVVSDDYQELVLDNLNPFDSFAIYYDKEIIDGDPILTEIETSVFDGLQDVNDKDVRFELIYSSNDNRLGIHMLDNDFLDRIILYEVTIKDKSGKIDDFVQMYNNNDIGKCPTGEDNCLIIDYADIERFIGQDTEVFVNVYYDNGIVGLDAISEYGFVFGDDDGKYLYLDEDSEFKVGNSISIYDFEYQDGSLMITDRLNEGIAASMDIKYASNGVTYDKYGIFDPKAISYGEITTEDNYFRFDSIIPKVSPTIKSRTINSVELSVDFSGLTLDNLKGQFELEDDLYYIYIDLCDDELCSNVIRNAKIEISLDSSDVAGYKVGSYAFSLLKPDTKYYYKLYAKLKQNDGSYKQVELFDASDSNGYTNSVYDFATYGASDITRYVSVYYESSDIYAGYDTGRMMYLKYMKYSADNYKLKLQLLDASGNDYFAYTRLNEKVYSDTLEGQEKVVSVKTPASATDWVYLWLDDKFVFGDGYYTLVLTAISTTPITDDNGEVVGYEELELYNKKLVSAGTSSSNSYVNVKELSDPVFTATPSSSLVTSSTDSTKQVPEINIKISVNDSSKVIINNTGDPTATRGLYNVRLTNLSNEEVCSQVVGLSASKEQSVTFSANSSNCDIKTDSSYMIYIDYYVYKNNASLGADDKLKKIESPYTVMTPKTSGVALGNSNISISDNAITLTYTGASNMDLIDKVEYSISVNGGENLGSGVKEASIFEVSSDGSTYELEITSTNIYDKLEFVKGNTYNVIVGYYHKNEDGVYELLFDENRGYSALYR